MSALGSGWDSAHRKLKETEAALEVALSALRKIRLGHPCDLPHVIAQVALEEVAGARPSGSLILK
ncbi:hypothetical protein SAMN06295937_1007100 [Sphingopyxis flava]|uniref:Uncharacterized protein n=1 Tax=Sphingopyxis flava TaxID=1507287 RepID=A0A1T5BSI7_9SPHN|nr:hypothetical protein SAMN06295937_1007100 [Sphingopyxis flava]